MDTVCVFLFLKSENTMASSSYNNGASEYSAITETQERLIIVDCFIISTIGLTLAILILYSLINLRLHVSLFW